MEAAKDFNESCGCSISLPCQRKPPQRICVSPLGPPIEATLSEHQPMLSLLVVSRIPRRRLQLLVTLFVARFRWLPRFVHDHEISPASFWITAGCGLVIHVSVSELWLGLLLIADPKDTLLHFASMRAQSILISTAAVCEPRGLQEHSR